MAGSFAVCLVLLVWRKRCSALAHLFDFRYAPSQTARCHLRRDSFFPFRPFRLLCLKALATLCLGFPGLCREFSVCFLWVCCAVFWGPGKVLDVFCAFAGFFCLWFSGDFLGVPAFAGWFLSLSVSSVFSQRDLGFPGRSLVSPSGLPCVFCVFFFFLLRFFPPFFSFLLSFCRCSGHFRWFLRAPEDGSVATWGHPQFGGDSSEVSEQLTEAGFAAEMENRPAACPLFFLAGHFFHFMFSFV